MSMHDVVFEFKVETYMTLNLPPIQYHMPDHVGFHILRKPG